MFHKDLIARGVTVIRDTVAALVFDDNLHAMLRRFKEDYYSFLIPNPVPAPELMVPYVVTARTPPEDSRTAFVAFPEGHSLNPEDIKDYFERLPPTPSIASISRLSLPSPPVLISPSCRSLHIRSTMVRVLEVLLASEIETARNAYLRILSMPTRLEVAKNAICLLLWLETTLGFNILGEVGTMALDGISLTRVVFEANSMYTFVLQGHYAMPPTFEGIPTIMALCGRGLLVDYRFFMFHKDLIARGVTMTRDTVAALVFNDNLHAMLLWYEEDHKFTPNPVPAPQLMAPFIVTTRTPPEDSRTALVCYQECCHPLSSEELENYFERRHGFGHCIERVATEQPGAGQSAKHAVIVFRSARLRDEAMFGKKTEAIYVFNGHDIRLQRYEPPY
ncbi:hypothetical protein BAE44_0001730 [Dichanthelium oligosanthes]|uniref:Uncharacterized protein n=1 Tax=Dichanthelium oligosanthes TaxID=888268 RepID=A0A1E5WJD8_9POAL|nr:hypothetical protein BAE44_0001730 [Dichanthelium oligosanthes]